MVLLHMDMLQSVRKYDAKLSNVLQSFQVGPFNRHLLHTTHFP
jgi:hypothetical protein